VPQASRSKTLADLPTCGRRSAAPLPWMRQMIWTRWVAWLGRRP